MCDIYVAGCAKCGTEIAMHLGDYNTSKDEIKVYCEKHIPKRLKDVAVWRTKSYGRVAVKALTENARENADINHPNEAEVVREI